MPPGSHLAMYDSTGLTPEVVEAARWRPASALQDIDQFGAVGRKP